MSSQVRHLREAGVSVWLDDLSRALLQDGTLAGYIHEHGLSGVTSNPSIFRAALEGSDRYDPQIDALLAAGVHGPEAVFFALALADVRGGARALMGAYAATAGADGYVSFEVTPDVAGDAEATIHQAETVHDWVEMPNLMVKVPATPAGMA